MSNIERNYKDKTNKEEIFAEMRRFLDTSLLQLITALEKHDVKYYLDSGTLLGAYRNGTSLTRDSDHDIAIKIEELMKPNGIAFLQEYSKNFSRSKRFTKSTEDSSTIEVFTDAETLLQRFDNDEPFVLSNLGWEATFNGDFYKYKSHVRRLEHKIDVFILYPSSGILNAENCKKFDNHYVYSLPFFREFFCRIQEDLLTSQSLVKAKYETFEGIVERDFTTYDNIETYLKRMYGESWQTPDNKYHWHGFRKYEESKIFVRDLQKENINSTLEIQNHYIFDKTLLN